MIEIKLLANRRFIYLNRKHSIVITAENKATEITVSFPEEYEEYSKRVDFINSQGKPWTKALFTPEFEEYPPDYNKTVFSFTLPDEVTKPGELKMQFLAYKPDESLTAVPFEIIPIQVDEGITCFKKGGKSNPDLLILSYNLANEALFNSQQAKSLQADSKQLYPSTIQYWLAKALDELGIEQVNVHSLRHTNISLQIAAGVPLKTVSARAGHSTTKVTADIYAHMIQSSDRAAADKLGEILG